MQLKSEIIKLEEKLLNNILGFTHINNDFSSVSNIITNSLNIFYNLPDTVSTSIFIMNEENYELEHRATIPYDLKNENINIFNIAFENGVIAKVLQSGQLQITKSNNRNIHFIPLFSEQNPYGFIIRVILQNEQKPSEALKNLYFISSSLISTHLENLRHINSLKYANSQLEQNVTTRTMDLAQSQRELNSILQSVLTGILVVEAKSQKIVKCNPIASVLLGLQIEEILDKNIRNFLEPIEQENGNQDFFIQNISSELKKSNGEIIPILRNISKIKMGKSDYIIESFLDISDRIKAEENLKKANQLLELKVKERTVDLQLMVHKLKEEISVREQAEKEIRKMLEREKELNKLKSRFVTMVSHEFRTPLTIIKSAAQMTLKFSDTITDVEKYQYLKRIVKTVDIMTDLIENVMFIGKSNTQIHENKSIKKIRLTELCREIVDNFIMSFNFERKINFYNESKITEIDSDPKLLQLILSNLLSNALKYSDASTAVKFVIFDEDEYLCLKIEDKGIGIPEKEQEKIFDLFYRGENVGNRSGTGLGMSVVLESIKQINGRIELKSKVNTGTSFIVKLPLTIKK